MLLTSKVAGLITLIIYYYLLRAMLPTSRIAPVIGTILLGTSYGFWRYSNEAEIYILATFVIIAVMFIMWTRTPTYFTAVLAGLLSALSILIHVTNLVAVLFAISFRLIYDRLYRILLLYLAVTLTITGAVYILVIMLWADQSVNVQHVSISLIDIIKNIRFSSFIKAIVILGHSILSQNYLFSYQPFVSMMLDNFPYRNLSEEIFMGEKAPFTSRIIPFITIFILVIATIYALYRLMRSFAANDTRPRAANIVPIALWLLSYSAVVTIFEPDNPELWIMALPPFFILVTLLVLHPLIKSGGRRIVWVITAIFVLHNYFGGIQLVLDKTSDYNWVKAQWLVTNATSADMIITLDNEVFSRYLRYYTSAKVVNIFSLDADRLKHFKDYLYQWPGQIYATADIFSPPSYLRYNFPNRYKDWLHFSQDIHADFHLIHDNPFGGIYVLGR
jgi:hypothetical protein